MGQLRRKVHNYTIVAVDKDGTIPDFHIYSFTALRVREGKEVGHYHCQSFPENDRKARQQIVKEFRAFIGDDLVLIGVVSDMIPIMEKLYLDNCEAYFTNVSLDLFPVVEEVDELVEDPEAFNQKVLSSKVEKDTLKKARLMFAIYEEAADWLFAYQEGYPYWVCSLPYEEERYMAKHLPERKRCLKTAIIYWIFGCHYFYLHKKWTNIVYWLTLGGFLVWMLIDLYRLPMMVDEANEDIATKTYKEAPKINRLDTMKWNVPEL